MTKRTFASRARTVAGSLPSGAFSAALIGAWLALTTLFAVGGVALLGTVVSALGRPQGVLTFLVTLAGAVGACAVAPTLARAVVVGTVERVAASLERDGGVAPGSRLFSLCKLKGRANCRNSCACC